MDIEVLDYYRRLQAGEFNLLDVGLLYLAGLGSVWLAARALPGRVPFERAGVLALGALAALLGLILTSTVYTCTSCNPPPGCDIVTVGVPFPQQLRDRDPSAEPRYDACWWSLTEPRPWAVAGNFALGTLGLPLLVALFRPRRDEDPDLVPGPGDL